MTQPANLSTSSQARSGSLVGTSPPAKLLGSWQLDRIIGQGTYTSVFDARPIGCPPSWPADYVVKTLRPEYVDDAAALAMMQRESEVGRHCSHPNLIPILESHLDPTCPYIVMPKLRGASLDIVIRHVGPLLVPQALWMTRQVAQALQHLHQQGWVHGDVKPANIVVSRYGHATLIDLAFAMRSSESLYSTQRPISATLAYVAPEMLTSSTQTQPASDVYSLGATVYELIRGRPPFVESEAARLVESHFQKTPSDLAATDRRVPEAVSHLVKRMLSKTPLRRPQSGDDLLDELTELEIETIESRFAQNGAA